MYKYLLFTTGIISCFLTEINAQELSKNFGDLASFTEIHAYVAVDISKRQGLNSEFDPHELYLNASSRISQNIKAVAEFEIEHGGQLLKMTKLFSEWNLDEKFNLKVGLDFAPFSVQDQVYYSPLRLRKFSSHATSTREILPTAWRETGLFVFGTFGDQQKIHLKYDVGVFNGLGSEAFNNVRDAKQSLDNNNNKMIAGRVSLNYSKHLQVGASYSMGKYDDLDQLDLKMWASHIIIQKNKFDLIGEYISSQTTDSVRTKTKSGGYVMMGYRFFENLLSDKINYIEPIIRLQIMESDLNVQDANDFIGYAFGFNYSPAEHYKFVLEYEVLKERFGQQIDNNLVSLEMVIDF
ncbi:MAG: hypothetical protein COA49_03410 [Bacteroidetes bacterium]|nr:MAG: hypothetical protein COA49_03410 [Bacteroidota bacterium]